MQTKFFTSGTVRRSLAALILPLMLALPFTANATFIDFTGTVTGGGTGSIPAPLNAGDPLTGVIQIDDAAAAPGSMFDDSNLLAFNFAVGSVNFSLSDATPFSFFSGTVANDGASLSQFQITTNLFGSIPNCGSCSLNLSNLPLNSASAPNSFTVQVLGFRNFGIAEGTLATSVRTADVPEPSVIAMFALGLIIIGWGVRRRSFYR